MAVSFHEDTASELRVVIDRSGWRFQEPGDELVFRALPTSERLSLRRQFGAQVALAKNTPTKGDT